MAKLSVDTALLKAKSYVKKGKIEEAQKLYQMVLQAFPENKRAQQGLEGYWLGLRPQDMDIPAIHLVKANDNVVHGLRHSFRDRLRAIECPSEIINELGGLSLKSVV